MTLPDTDDIDEDEAIAWAVWGFKQSHEGFNGEYPFSFNDEDIRAELEHKLWKERNDD